jgi:hypothetical protein
LTEEIDCDDEPESAPCVALASLAFGELAPTPPDKACTEIFGGPDTAALEGSIAGEEIDVELTRANGCEIERFDAAVPLLQALFPDYEPGSSLQP